MCACVAICHIYPVCMISTLSLTFKAVIKLYFVVDVVVVVVAVVVVVEASGILRN